MARYRQVDLSPRLQPVDLESQLVPGTFAHAAHVDLTAFDAHWRLDDTTRPLMLLKVLQRAYPQGQISSRRIEQACHDNVLFIAISGDGKHRFTSRLREAITAKSGPLERKLGFTRFAAGPSCAA